MGTMVAAPLTSTRRAGVAVLAVVVLGVGLALAAHAALLLGRSIEMAARTDARAFEVDTRLRARLHAAVEGIDSLFGELPSGVRGRALTPELRLLEADSVDRAAWILVTALDPAVRVRAAGAGVRTGLPLPFGTDARITVWAPDVDACVPGTSFSDLARLRSDAWEADPLSLGLAGDALPPGAADLPREPPSRAIRLTPRGDLTIPPGAWTVVALVPGDLRVTRGATVTGWMAARGEVVIEGGGTLRGVIRAGGRVRVESGGSVEVAPCTAARTLAGISEGHPPHVVPFSRSSGRLSD
ncbi:MAG: hypothetical protein RQ745_01695 [Longimicrobiales bacterium]|nr:hypothetical protein [Longimicrobiales bacterium]